MATELVWPKADGDILYASNMNESHNVIKQLYTGSAFNTTASSTGGTQTNSYEMTAVSTTQRDYVRVTVCAFSNIVDTNGGGNDSTSVRIEIKETAGAYSDILGTTTFHQLNAVGTVSHGSKILSTITAVYALTAGMKTNGFQVKLTSTSNTSTTNDTATFTNKFSVLEIC